MSLNWLGASTNSFRILLASSIVVMKSTTLKPKLIVTNSYVKLARLRASDQPNPCQDRQRRQHYYLLTIESRGRRICIRNQVDLGLGSASRGNYVFQTAETVSKNDHLKRQRKSQALSHPEHFPTFFPYKN